MANPPNSAQLGGSLYHAPDVHPGPCSSVGVRPRTVRQTYTQTRVTTIHFASSTTQAKCDKPVGFYGPIALPVPNAPSSDAPSSECPRASIAARRRFNQNIPPSIVLLQQCHCRNRHGANFKIYLLLQFCSNRVQFFYNTQETQTQKNYGPEF